MPDPTSKTIAPSVERFIARYSDPAIVLGEVLFGLIMVLTVMLTASIWLGQGELGVRHLLLAAVGRNFAWGIIDGVLFVIISLTERNGQARFIESVQQAPNSAAALALIRTKIEPTLVAVVDLESRETLYQAMYVHVRQVVVQQNRITRDDVIRGFLCAGFVMSSCIPAVVPLVIFQDNPALALRVSIGLLLLTLFFVGHSWGRHMHLNRWLAGVSMLAIGLALVGVAVLFGG